MTAAEVREALRRRHPATQHMGLRVIHGAWTTIEEWHGIDLLAISAHSAPATGKVRGVRYPRVGYEVKVSRSDYRRELLRPGKRQRQVAWCNAFYFAVPRGLLNNDELAFEQPDAGSEAFTRERCPEASTAWVNWSEVKIGPCIKGKREAKLVGPLREYQRSYRPYVESVCSTCNGKGYIAKSLAERDWPTLWVPPDVGLIEIDARGCHVTRESPVRKEVPGVNAGLPLADLIRWVSVRPDPRHVDLLLGKAGT